jgi:hypothetical protein
MTKQELNDIETAARKAYHWPSPGQTQQDREVIASMAKLFDEIEWLTAERDAARNMLEGICSEFEGTVAHADWKAEGSKGMSVPFHGDFASAVQLPSVVGKMRWWSRQMRKVIGEKVE